MPGITEDTKLILHFTGNHGAQCFWDYSDSVHCITAGGNAQVDTAIKKWTTGSLKLDGSADSLSSPDSPDWDVVADKTDSWTIDFQARHNAIDEDGTYLTQVQDATNRWVFLYQQAGSVGVLFVVLADGAPVITLNIGARLAAAAVFYHIALCKVLDEYGLYVNGVQLGYLQDDTEANFTGSLYVGDDGYASGQELAGNIDGVRIHKANYFEAAPNVGLTDTIDVPTAEYARAVEAVGVPPGVKLSKHVSL